MTRCACRRATVAEHVFPGFTLSLRRGFHTYSATRKHNGRWEAIEVPHTLRTWQDAGAWCERQPANAWGQNSFTRFLNGPELIHN